ncbi:MAG TPA: hypothetical protein VE219_00520 [Candidatus Sulfotelmatobacter sp.]|nr:hypothetical protein [Candidatus Sulfotelmatobacter sp.]
MAEVIPYGAAAVLLVGAWVAGLAYLDVLTSPDVKAWRRLAALRGFALPPGRLERAAENSPLVRRVQEELDLDRLLVVAGRAESPLGFLGRSLFLGGLSAAAVLGVDLFCRTMTGDWFLGLGPWAALLAWVSLPAVRLLRLQRAARDRQAAAGRILGDSMMLVAIITDGRGLQLDDAVKILSRCAGEAALRSIVEERGWERLVRGSCGNTIELYRRIGDSYGIPTFHQVADAAANANLGFPERETYLNVAKAVYAERLAAARVKAARAKTLVTVPVAGMLIPLLLLIGAPTYNAISNGLGAR